MGLARTALMFSQKIAAGGGGSIALTTTTQEGADAASVTTGSSGDPSGSDRAVYGGAVGLFTASDQKYGGSGGTSLTKQGSDVTSFFGTAIMSTWEEAPGPNSTTTGYTLFGGSGVCCMSQLFLENVNQTTPFEASTLTTNAGQDIGGSTSIVADLVFALGAGYAGRKVAWTVGLFSLGAQSISAITEDNADTIIESQEISPSNSGQNAIVQGIATLNGSGAVTVQVSCTLSGSVANAFTASGVVINPV